MFDGRGDAASLGSLTRWKSSSERSSRVRGYRRDEDVFFYIKKSFDLDSLLFPDGNASSACFLCHRAVSFLSYAYYFICSFFDFFTGVSRRLGENDGRSQKHVNEVAREKAYPANRDELVTSRRKVADWYCDKNCFFGNRCVLHCDFSSLSYTVENFNMVIESVFNISKQLL